MAKISVLSHLLYRLSAIPTDNPESDFVDIDKLILNFICRGKSLRIANSILKERTKSGASTNYSPLSHGTQNSVVLVQE